MKKQLLSLIALCAVSAACYGVSFDDQHPACKKDGMPCCANFKEGKLYTREVCKNDAICVGNISSGNLNPNDGRRSGYCENGKCIRRCSNPRDEL